MGGVGRLVLVAFGSVSAPVSHHRGVSVSPDCWEHWRGLHTWIIPVSPEKKKNRKKKAVSGFKPSSVEGVFAQGHCDLLAAGMEATTFWKQMLLLSGQMLADADGFRTEL